MWRNPSALHIDGLAGLVESEQRPCETELPSVGQKSNAASRTVASRSAADAPDVLGSISCEVEESDMLCRGHVKSHHRLMRGSQHSAALASA
mmetsp:Transcript_5450/g.11422  ORF Transcript_5450/g.11422 Transcript_5450/m.11422 type:complete len:92 (-) Transcript_5450:451-726(-)